MIVNENSRSPAPKIDSGDSATPGLKKRGPAKGSRSAPKKILSVMSGLMDLMVEGLAPGAKRQRRSYELIVVGAGPTGTSAAICAASDGIDTLIVDSSEAEAGGDFIDCLDNCAANPAGITLGTRDELNAGRGRRFRLDMKPGLAVTGIREDGGRFRVETNQGYWLEAKSIVLAPGLHRHRLNIDGEEALAGAGVYTCAHCDGPDYIGKDIIVIGSGDSGIEQALFLANLAKSVTVVEKSDRASCSLDLYQMVKDCPNVDLRLNTIVRAFEGIAKLRSVRIEDAKTGEMDELQPAAAFISVGLQPATGVFRSSVDLDARGFIKTDGSMQTSLSGVFAAGHARTKSIRDNEDAAGEGYRVASIVGKYLEYSRR